ncbi:hypothetical protein [Evansella tamaricis]|uniref:Uncharacterized protein n=1 Tax=Evansella tamaricis TaxID=2069301 RepID=A0ABS6JGG7_9BACI|nr:hypothetical protein [Evansella tamaricis]MBU9712738.1 hypothetical protein [Evansella tamaricis]
MKKLVFIGSLLFLLLLVACNNGNDASGEKQENLNVEGEVNNEVDDMEDHEVKENVFGKEDGIPFDEFNGNVREEFQVTDSNGQRFIVYLFSENEEEFTEEHGWAGADSGDLITQGDYQFALREVDGEFVVIQSTELNNWMFNHDRTPFYVTENEPDVIFFRETLSSNAVENLGFIIDEEELHLVTYPDFISNSSIYKKMEQNTFQHFWYNNQQGSWTFHTILLNVAEREFELLETFEFSGDEFRLGEVFATEFHEDEEFFVTADLEYELDPKEEVLDTLRTNATNGYLYLSGHHVGTSFEEMEAASGLPDEKMDDGGNIMYSYSDYNYYAYYNFLTGTGGDSVDTITYLVDDHFPALYREDLIAHFGTPNIDNPAPHGDGYDLDFTVGNYSILFILEDEHSPAVFIRLDR